MIDNTPRMPTQADIAQRAYEIWERRQWEHGYDISDWVLAEHELNQEFKEAVKAMHARDAREREVASEKTKVRTA